MLSLSESQFKSMNSLADIHVDHSTRRPRSQAWSASSQGHTTYGHTREEAIERHKAVLEVYQKITASLKLCAKCH